MHRFLSQIAGWPHRAIDWLCSGRSDYVAFQSRKATPAHRARRTLCLFVWSGAAVLMLLCPSPGCVATFILIATFVSFSVLDERP
ncbi:hypothetical protein [Thiocapsa rosea]|uniref:Uncharacterized protein n=1 Tax=Thiocapsa rosea TaxID=69360 RepID=A0A495V823_9GAMM|nr:hypothetical protein [Thiocapsa rosea]RKT43928.1 hypothetical protein BDD21_1292 [Thiocapsa rosea]